MLRLRRDKLFWYCMFLGALFFPQMLRNAFVPSDMLKYLNPFLLAAYINALFMSTNHKRISSCAIGLNKRMVAVIVLAFFSLLSNVMGTGKIGGAMLIEVLLVFPIIVLARYEVIYLESRMLFKGIKIFNAVILVIIIVGYANIILGNTINVFLWDFLAIRDYETNMGRLWSVYGHPLYNTFLFLAYFTINYATRDIMVKPAGLIYLIVTTMLGMVLAASKAGILIILFLVIILLFSNIRIFIAEVIAISLLNLTGMFDLTIQRFAGDSLSSYRFEKYALIKQMSFYRGFRLFYGYGSMYALRIYNKLFVGASAAFEMPILAYSLDYGILYTVIFIGLTVGIPIAKFVKRKQWQMIFCYMAVAGYINTYNGITIHGDYLGVYIFYILLMLKISDLKLERRANYIHGLKHLPNAMYNE